MPDTGHSVLGEEPTACAQRSAAGAVRRHADQAVPRRRRRPRCLRPPPLPPRASRASRRRAATAGWPGRTLHAVALTLADFGRQLALQLLGGSARSKPRAAATLRVGGLRAGWARSRRRRDSPARLLLRPGRDGLRHDRRRRRAELRIGGSAAAHGTLRAAARNRSLVGTLGGRASVPATGHVRARRGGYCRRRCRRRAHASRRWRLCCAAAAARRRSAGLLGRRRLASASCPARAPPASPARRWRCRSTARARVPGTISLSVERRLAGAAPSRDAVVALAGGPGQAALPLGRIHRPGDRPGARTRDLLVFDQRGTGSSDPLSCAALESSERRASAERSELSNSCALQLGPARGAYTTQRIGRGHRGAPAGRRLRKARPLRDLLRHQGGARVRRALPPERRSAGARLGRAADRAPNRSHSPPSRRSPGVLDELCARRRLRRVITATRSATSRA